MKNNRRAFIALAVLSLIPKAGAQFLPVSFWKKKGSQKKVILLSQNGTIHSAVSSDGTTWTTSTLPSTNPQYYGGCHGNGTFCAVGRYVDSAMLSTDGSTWTASPLPGSSGSGYQSAGFGGGKFVVIGAHTVTAVSSNNGASWTTGSMPAARNWYGVAHNGSVFVAVAYNSSTAAVSADGISWTEVSLPSTQSWFRVVWTGSLFIAFAANELVYATSPNGTTWTSRTLSGAPGSYGVGSACWNGQKVCVLFWKGGCGTSSDGLSWTYGSMPAQRGYLGGIAWNGKVFVAPGYYDEGNSMTRDVYHSADGLSWTASTVGGAGTGWKLTLAES